MRKQIDHFLLGLLWLLASTLGASFWFNTKFGFNIFSIPHWQYLGQLQASKASIQPSFYISMVLIVVVMITGLYLIVRPRFRKIYFKSNGPAVMDSKPAPTVAAAPAPALQTAPVVETPSAPVVPTGPAIARPPRLNLPTHNGYGAAAQTPAGNYPQPNVQTPSFAPAPAPVVAPVAQPQPESLPSNFEDIEQIFKSAGYLIKKAPRIGGIRPALFAIGSDETLWIGGVGMEPSRMANAVDKLDTIFTETLEDIKITINSFIINPKIDNPADMVGIEQFDSVNALRDYMDSHKNRELPPSEAEDFDAYSEYIDTVADYFNKS